MDTTNLSPEEKIELIRRSSLTNLFYFGRKVMGNEYLTEDVHGKLATWLTSPDRKRFKLILLPRDCLKTTFISQVKLVLLGTIVGGVVAALASLVAHFLSLA